MLKEISWHLLELAGVHVHGMDALYPMQWLTFRRESSETTLGENTKDPTTHWGSERIGCKD